MNHQAVLTNPSMTYRGNQRPSIGRRILAALEIIGANRAAAELRRQGLPVPESLELPRQYVLNK